MLEKQELKEEITVEQAKKILGKAGQKMTDKEIQSLLNMLRGFCNKVIDSIAI